MMCSLTGLILFFIHRTRMRCNLYNVVTILVQKLNTMLCNKKCVQTISITFISS